jgi:hypothetical protein
MAFRQAVQDLEGRLRCLRIANHKDLVALLPDRHSWSGAYMLFCPRMGGINTSDFKSNSIQLLAIRYLQKAGDANESYLAVVIQEYG